jgi:hypothetical protein
MGEHVSRLAVSSVLTCHSCDVWQWLFLLRSRVARAGEEGNRGTLSGQGLLEFCSGRWGRICVEGLAVVKRRSRLRSARRSLGWLFVEHEVRLRMRECGWCIQLMPIGLGSW